MAWMIRRSTIIGAACLVICALTGCGRRDEPEPPAPDRPASPAAATDSASTPEAAPEANIEARLHAQWQAKVKGLDLNQASGINESNETIRKLVGALSAEEFELLCAHVISLTPSTMTPFQMDLLAFAAMRMARTGDRERLVGLLAQRCPRAIPPAPIEFTLAAEERRGKLPDGFTVLVDAYRAATNDEARATLLSAMAAAMPSLRAKNPDDTAFVAAVESWHAARRGQLPDLRPKYVFAWQDHRFDQGNEDLFETP